MDNSKRFVKKIKSGGVIGMGGGTGGGAFGQRRQRRSTIDIKDSLLNSKEIKYIQKRVEFKHHEAESLEEVTWNMDNLLVPLLKKENERYHEKKESAEEEITNSEEILMLGPVTNLSKKLFRILDFK